MIINKNNEKVNKMTNEVRYPTRDSGKVSSDILEYLRKQGNTYNEIGNKIGCTESFISLALNGKRRLSIEHLCAIEEQFSIPLPELLLLARQTENIPPAYQEKYRSLKSAL